MFTVTKLQSLNDGRDIYEDAPIKTNTPFSGRFYIKKRFAARVDIEFIGASDIDADLIMDMLSIERKVFPPNERGGSVYMKAHLASEKGISFLFRDSMNGKLVGYGHMVPSNEAWLMEGLSDEDTRYEAFSGDDTLYLSDICLLEDYRGRSGMGEKFDRVFDAAREKGFARIAMHTSSLREADGVSNSDKFRNMGFELKWTEEHWCGGDDAYDFLVLDLENKREETRPEEKSINVPVKRAEDEEVIVNTLLGLLISSSLRRKTVLAFDNSLGGMNSQKVLDVFQELKKAAGNSTLGKLLERTVVIVSDADKISTEIGPYADNGNNDVFLFVKDDNARKIQTGDVNVYVAERNEKDLTFEGYYPLAEIVIISLASRMRPSIIKDMASLTEGLGISTDAGRRKMIFTILPDMERYDHREAIKRYARLKFFLRSA
jgi:hypothetical protein